MIEPDPANEERSVATVEGSQQGWPDEATGWQYSDDAGWHNDPLLTVTERPPPEYPDSLTIRDLSGKRMELVAEYQRIGNSLVWKYGDYEIARNGNLWCITGDNGQCIPVTGWDYAEDHIWPDTHTLYIWDFPDYINITSSGPAAKKLLFLMGRYKLETDKSAQLKPVYKKTDRDVFIFYARTGKWTVGDDITEISGWIKCEKTGLQTIPTTGWKYWDGTGWPSDDTINFSYN